MFKRAVQSLLALIILTGNVNAQSNANAIWIRHSCGIVPNGGSAYGDAIASDKFGNSFCAGMIHGYAFTIDTLAYTIGNKQLHLSKFDVNGKRLWTTAFGGPKSARITVTRMVCDQDGNLYMVGNFLFTFSDTVLYFGPIQVTSGSGGGVPGFIAKIDPDGKPLWIVRSTSTTSNYLAEVTDVAINGDRIVFCGHAKSGTNKFGSYALTTTKLYSAFVAEMDTSGTILNARLLDSSSYSKAYGIAVSSISNNVYVVGEHLDSMHIDGLVRPYITGHTSSFIVKLNNNLKASWIRGGTSDGFTSGMITSLKRAELDSRENLYMAANGAGDTTRFGRLYFSHNVGTSSLKQDIYVVKYDKNGNEQWIRHGGSDKNDYLHDLAVDDRGNCIISIGTGTNTTSACIFENDSLPTSWVSNAAIVKYDTNGLLDYAKVIHEGTVGRQLSMSIDSIFFLCGNKSSSGMPFDTITTATDCEHPDGGGASYGTKMFVAKFYDGSLKNGGWGTNVPVTWLYFNAERFGPDASVLNWATSQEINNEYFTVQHSTNGINFTDIGIVKSAGNSTTAKYYAFIHTEPVPGANYYRIRQTDFNGASEYSVIRSVNFIQNGDITVIPNPSVDGIKVQLPESITGNVVVSIMDMTGKVILSRKVSASEVNSGSTWIDLSMASAGTYVITIILADRVYTKQVIKN